MAEGAARPKLRRVRAKGGDAVTGGFWDSVSPSLRRVFGLHPLTQEEADKAMAEAPEVEISDEEIDRIVENVTRLEREPRKECDGCLRNQSDVEMGKEATDA